MLTATRAAVPALAGLLALALSPTVAGPPAQAASPAPVTQVNARWSTDKGAPVVDSLDVSRAVVDTDAGPAQVHLTVRAHDTGGPGAATGIHEVSVLLDPGPPPTGRQVGSSLTAVLAKASDGSWQGTVTVPAYTNATYDAVAGAEDNAGVGTLSDPNQGGLSLTGAVRAASSSGTDLVAPQLTDLSLSTTRIDTRTTPASLTVEAVATDAGSGVRSVSVELTRFKPSYSFRTITLDRVPGTDRFRAHVRFLRWLGDHHESLSAYVIDNAGNLIHVRSWTLEKRDLPSGVTVVSGPYDARGPRVVRVLRAASSVDIRRHGRWYPVRVLVADRHPVTRVRARLRSLAGSDTALRLVSGTVHRGVWAGRIRVPRCSIAPVTSNLGVVTEDDHGVRGGRRIRTVRVLSSDHVPPTARGIWRHSPHVFTFSEPVHGIAPTNVRVYDADTATGPHPMGGTWTCRNGAGSTVSCLTGEVEEATFDPDDPNAPNPGVVDWEPGSHLDVLDRHGNPFDGPSLSPDVID